MPFTAQKLSKCGTIVVQSCSYQPVWMPWVPLLQHSDAISTVLFAVHMDDSNITRTNSGPDANMDDPDAYFDQVCLAELTDMAWL